MVHASYVCHDVRIIREQAADRTLLTNARADYLLLGAPNASNYDGLFVRWNEKEMRKILWNVLPKGTLRSVEIDGKSITRTFDGAKHTFAFDEEGALFSCEGDHTLTLDCKRLYDESDTQRIYDMRAVRMADDHAIDRSLARIAVFDVLYRKGDEYSIPVCIATTMRASPIGSWRSVEYAYDKRRGTQSTTWVFDALSLEGSGLVAIAAHQDPKRAHNAAVTLLLRERTLFAAKERATHLMPLVQLGVRALHALQTQHGIVAGLPWFYRTWSRDELIAAGGLLATGELDEVADILERWFGAVRQDGTLPAIFPDEGLVSADAPGWLGVRTRELLEHDPQLRIVPCERAARWCAASERMLLAMRAHHTRNGLVFSASKTTWMDTDDGGDGRTGMCIEIQALTFALVQGR